MKQHYTLSLLTALSIVILNPALAVSPDDELPDPTVDTTASTQMDAMDSSSRAASVDQAFRYARAFIESGLYKPAILQLEDVLAVVPQDADANYYMGLARLGLEETEMAMQYLSSAIEFEPEYYVAYEQLGLIYLQTGNIEGAQNLLATLESKLQVCADQCAPALGMAVSSLQAALQAGQSGAVHPAAAVPDTRFDSRLLYRQAIALVNSEDYQQAITVLNQTRSEFGPHPDILTYLGYSYRKLQAYERAVFYYRQALSIDPDHKPANEYLGELFVETGDISRALIQLHKLEQLCPFSCYEQQELQRWISQVQ